jgi:cell wall-associated NlpC family hydrolase
MTEQEQRMAVVAEARTWLRIPFFHGARLKGIGADCETFICEVFAAAGVFTAQGIPYVPAQWFLNTKEELYLKYLSRYAKEYVPADHPILPGDIICVKHRWVYSHGAIVLEWPRVIHCYPPCAMESNVFYNPVFAHRELKFFNPWKIP